MTPSHRRLQVKKNVLPTVVVRDPTTHDTWEHGKFTSYLICIKTDHSAFHIHLSAVRRRFSELLWLHKLLRYHHPQVKLPRPPPTNLLAKRFSHEYILARQHAIQEYLNELLKIDTVLSDFALHLFLQTDLTVDEIDKYLDGNLSEETVTIAWRNSGHLHTSSFLVSSVVAITYKPEEIVMNEEDLRPPEQDVSRLSSPSSIADRDIEDKNDSDSNDSKRMSCNNDSSSNGCSNSNSIDCRSNDSSDDNISQTREITHATYNMAGQQQQQRRPIHSDTVSDTSHAAGRTHATMDSDTATSRETNHPSIRTVRAKGNIDKGFLPLPDKNLKPHRRQASTITEHNNIV